MGSGWGLHPGNHRDAQPAPGLAAHPAVWLPLIFFCKCAVKCRDPTENPKGDQQDEASGAFRTVSRLVNLSSGDSLQTRIAFLLVGSYLVTRYVGLCAVLMGSDWVCLSCLFYLELSVTLPSGFTSCFLSCPTWPERASLTLPLTGGPGGDSAGSAVPGSESAAGKTEKLSTMLRFLVCQLQGRCDPPVLVALPKKGQDLGKCLDGDSEPVLC